MVPFTLSSGLKYVKLRSGIIPHKNLDDILDQTYVRGGCTCRSQSLVRVTMLSLLAHPYFKHDIEQETMRKTLLTKQETEHFE